MLRLRVFAELAERKAESSAPLGTLFKKNTKEVVLSALIFIGNNAVGYMIIAFFAASLIGFIPRWARLQVGGFLCWSGLDAATAERRLTGGIKVLRQIAEAAQGAGEVVGKVERERLIVFELEDGVDVVEAETHDQAVALDSSGWDGNGWGVAEPLENLAVLAPSDLVDPPGHIAVVPIPVGPL